MESILCNSSLFYMCD